MGRIAGRADPQYSVVLSERDFLGQRLWESGLKVAQGKVTVTSTPAITEHDAMALCADFDFIRALIRSALLRWTIRETVVTEDHGNERAI